MNPHAKEFVPAHILKQRQEEAQRLDNLTEQLNKVDLESEDKIKGDESNSSAQESTTTRRDETERRGEAESADSNDKSKDEKAGAPTDDKHENHSSKFNDKDLNNHLNSNNVSNQSNGGDYPEEQHDLDDEEDDRFLLKAGENICEFNGEQFIIPGDDEFDEPQQPTGYDFGNAEDNEDEDVCNAFEEFLGNLPDQ